MLWFKKKKMKQAETLTHAKAATADVASAKRHTTRQLKQVDDSNARLKELLEANGITFKIHIATRGGHHNVR